MQLVDTGILSNLHRPQRVSHKGDNGRVFVIAGSEKYHGSVLLSVQAASRVSDLVYVFSTQKNLKLIDKLKSQTAVFISVDEKDLWPTVKISDAILIGPGMDVSASTKSLLENILKNFTDKKIVLDAGALYSLDLKLMFKNCILTPHAKEFEDLFRCAATPQNVLKMSKQFNCVIVLKGASDYISNGEVIYENQTGNAGMTKGGTGDVLAGLICALASQNDVLTAAAAGAYLNGLAGDKLYGEKGTFFNAEDLILSVGKIWGEYLK